MIKKAIAVIVATVMLLFAPITKSFDVMKTEKGEIVFVFSEDEVDRLNTAIGKLRDENESLRAKVAKYERTCI